MMFSCWYSVVVLCLLMLLALPPGTSPRKLGYKARLYEIMKHHPIELRDVEESNLPRTLMQTSKGEIFSCKGKSLARLAHETDTNMSHSPYISRQEFDNLDGGKKLGYVREKVSTQLLGKCLLLFKDYWTYQLCPRKNMKQMVFDWERKATLHHVHLGRFSWSALGTQSLTSQAFQFIHSSAEKEDLEAFREIRQFFLSADYPFSHDSSFDNSFVYLEHYVGGKKCEETEEVVRRTTTVEYRCCLPKSGETMSFLSIEEPSTCLYHAVVCTLQMCDITTPNDIPSRKYFQVTRTSINAVLEAAHMISTLEGGCFSLHQTYWTYELCIGEELTQSHKELRQYTENGASYVEQYEALRFSLGTFQSVVSEDLLDMKVRFRALEEDKYITVLDNGLKAQYHRGAPYREVYIGSDLIVKEGLIIDPDHPENTYYSAILTNGSKCTGDGPETFRARTTELRFYCTKYSSSAPDTSRMDVFGYGLQPKDSNFRLHSITSTTESGYSFFRKKKIPGVIWTGPLKHFPHSLKVIEEGPACHYTATFTTPAVCNHHSFMQEAPIPPSRVECTNHEAQFGGWEESRWKS